MMRHTTETLGCVSMAWKGSTRLWGFAFVLNAAVAGAGVAIGKTALAVDDLRAGRLICLFDSVVPEEMAYYAVYRPGALDQPRVRVFRD